MFSHISVPFKYLDPAEVLRNVDNVTFSKILNKNSP